MSRHNSIWLTCFLLLVRCLGKPDSPAYGPAAPALADSDLLDVVLVASVDGKFHALNRTTGHSLWSMSSFGATPQASTIAPLVRTSHIDYDPDLADDSIYQETYIIEPQSGDIYVLATPTSPLQRFPFTMSELVDMSPFSFNDNQVFVGKKETSSLLVDLATGKVRVKSNSECQWDPLEDIRQDEGLDLNELDGTKPAMDKPTEVYIGRTDYHVSIHARTANSDGTPIQNLSFSTYGPNPQDSLLQEDYRNTKDDAYVQGLPSGEIISFKAHETNSVLWAYKFSDPIVAIFDVFRTQAQRGQTTFVLLQPHPQMSAILPQLKLVTSVDQLPHLDSAYIGLVKETGSLFAMSPERFPLVAFSDGGRGQHRIPSIEPAYPIDSGELPPELDKITDARKQRERERALDEREYSTEGDDRCRDRSALYSDRRCLVGIRPLEGGDGDGPEMRMKRLIEGVPTVPWGTEEKEESQEGTYNTRGLEDLFGDTVQAGAKAAAFIPTAVIPGRKDNAVSWKDVIQPMPVLPDADRRDNALFWKGVIIGIVIGFAPLALWLGIGKAITSYRRYEGSLKKTRAL